MDLATMVGIFSTFDLVIIAIRPRVGVDMVLRYSLCSNLIIFRSLLRAGPRTPLLAAGIVFFPLNWKLSLVRAVSIVKCQISSGVIALERLSTAGYADT
jgi:hypothetical protein